MDAKQIVCYMETPLILVFKKKYYHCYKQNLYQEHCLLKTVTEKNNTPFL